MEATPQFTLDMLGMGATGCVVRVEGQDALAERLVDYGFWPGTRVSVLRRSAFGGPVAYRLRGFRLALRPSEAARIVIAQDA